MTKFTHALTRLPGANFAAGLTPAAAGPPDLNLALRQHAAYRGATGRARGYSPLQVDVSEFREMDGGLSCLSLRF